MTHSTATVSPPLENIDWKQPWPGLSAYTEEWQRFFHGRSKEVDDLFRRVRNKVVTVLFGQSGLGKTSVLQAGLFPRLREEGFVPVFLRIDYAPEAPRPLQQIRGLIASALTPLGFGGAALPQGDESLWEYFHRRDARLVGADGQAAVLVLVFDQFEELFTVGQSSAERSARAASLVEELAQCVENQVPAPLEQLFEENAEELLQKFVFDRQDFRVLLSLREDYLAHLEGLRERMPSIAGNRMRLNRMNGLQSLEAVLDPGAGLLTEEVGQQIVRFVATGKRDSSTPLPAGDQSLAGLDVEPSLLSLVCSELNKKRQAAGMRQITADLLADTSEHILQDFYERSLADQPEGVWDFIEQDLLTDSGFRENVALERAGKSLTERGAPPDAIAILVERRLLHLEERLQVQRVELTHDVLTGVVRKSRVERQAKSARRRAYRRGLLRAGIVAIVLIVGLGLGAREYGRSLLSTKNDQLQIALAELEVKNEVARKAVAEKGAVLAELEKTNRDHAQELIAMGMDFAQQGNLVRGMELLADGMSSDNSPKNKLRLGSILARFPRLHRLRQAGNVVDAAFSPGGDRFVVIVPKESRPAGPKEPTHGFLAQVIQVDTEVELHSFALDHLPKEIRFVAEDRILVHSQKTLRGAKDSVEGDLLVLWKLGSPHKEVKQVLFRTSGRDRLLAFSRNGQRLAILTHREVGVINQNPLGTSPGQPRGSASPVDGTKDPAEKRYRFVVEDRSVPVDSTKPNSSPPAVVRESWESDEVVWAGFSRDGAKVVWARTKERLQKDRMQKGPVDADFVAWDLNDKASLSELKLPAYDKVVKWAVSDDSRWLVTISDNESAQCWDLTRKYVKSGSGANGTFNKWDEYIQPTTSFESVGTTLGSAPPGTLALPNPVRHSASILDASVSPDGEWFATAGSDGSARVWRTAFGSSASQPMYHGGSAARLARFSPDGRYLLTAGEDGAIRFWDLQPPMVLCGPTRLTRNPRLVLASPRGERFLLVNGDGQAWVCPTDGSHGEVTLERATPIAQAWFSPDASRLATLDYDHKFHIWDTAQGKLLAGFHHPSAVYTAAFSPEGTRLAVISRGRGTRLYGGARYDQVSVLDKEHISSQAVFSGDGKTLVVLMGKLFQVRNGMTGDLLSQHSFQGRTFYKAALSRTGKLLGLADFSGNVLGHHACLVRLDALERSKVEKLLLDSDTDKIFLLSHRDNVNGIEFHEGESRVLTWSQDSTAAIWDCAEGKRLFTFRHGGPVGRASYCDRGQAVATVSNGVQVQVWDANSEEALTAPVVSPWPGVNFATFFGVSTATDHGERLPGPRLVMQNNTQVCAWSLAIPPRELDHARLYVRSPSHPVAENWAILHATHFQSCGERMSTDDWHRQRADSLMTNNETSASLWHLERLLAHAPAADRAVIAARRGDALLRLGKYDAALQAYREPGPAFPWDEAAVYIAKARLQFAKLRMPAKKIFTGAEFGVDDLKTVATVMQLLDEAEKCCAAKNVPLDMRGRDGAASLRAAFIELASLCLDRSDLIRAQKALDRSEHIETIYPWSARSAPFWGYWQTGATYRRLSTIYETKKDWPRATDAVWRGLEAYLSAGTENLIKSDRDDMAALATKLADLAPKISLEASAECNGKLLASLGRFLNNDAKDDWAKLESMRCYLRLSRLQRILKDPDREEKLIRSALELGERWLKEEPEIINAQSSVAAILGELADALFARRQYEAAQEPANRALKLSAKLVNTNPKGQTSFADALVRAGKIQLMLGNKQAGALLFDQSIKLFEVVKGGNELNVEERLTDKDPKHAVTAGAYRSYPLQALRGQIYEIEMRSKELDSYLIVANDKGTTLASDDNGGGGMDARIVFVAPADGGYRVIATTFKGNPTGPFTLHIRPSLETPVNQLTKVAKAYFDMGDYAKAIDYYNSSIALDAGSLSSWGGLGDAQFNLGNPKEALIAYERFLQLAQEMLKTKMTPAVKQTVMIAHACIGKTQIALQQPSAALEAYRAELALARELAQDKKDPESRQALGNAHDNVGKALLALNQPKEAMEEFQNYFALAHARAQAEPKISEAQRDLEVAYERIGDTHRKLGNFKEARAAFEKELDISRRRASAMPEDPQTQRDVALSLIKLGDLHLNANGDENRNAKAAEYYSSAVALDAGSMAAWGGLGDARFNLGNPKEALAAYEQSLQLAQLQVKKIPALKRAVMILHASIGKTQYALQQPRAALQAYRDELALARALAQDKNNPAAQDALGIAHDHVGKTLIALNQPREAMEEFQSYYALACQQALARPKDDLAQRNLGVALERMGDAHVKLGSLKEAREAYEQQVGINLRRFEARPDNVQAMSDLYIAYGRLGDAFTRLKDPKKARLIYEKEVEISRRRFKASPADPQALRNLANSHGHLGHVLLDLGEFKSSAAHYRDRVDIYTELFKKNQNALNRRSLTSALGSLAFAVLFNREPQRAIAAAKEALKLDPKEDWIRTNLAHGYLFDDKYDLAKSIYLQYKDVKVFGKQTFAEAVLDDFKQFKMHGITHPKMESIERLLSVDGSSK